MLIDSKFKPKIHISHSACIKCGTASNGSAFTNLTIPHTKTKPNGDDICMTDTLCDCSFTYAFNHHLRSNSAVPGDAPLFAFKMGVGTWSPMRWTWFLSHCAAVWDHVGLQSIKDHGFRIGGTTHLLLLGVDPWVVMVQGRWSSQSFLGYWGKCEEILPLFISSSFHSHDSIVSAMVSFKKRLMA